MTGGWAATNTLPGKPPYRIAGIPPGIISADDYDVTEEALAYLARAALVEAALDAAETHLSHTDRFCVDKDAEADLTCPTYKSLAAALRAVREGKRPA